MCGTGPIGTDAKDIHDQVHTLNKLVHKQLEEANKRYMELYEHQ